MQTKDAIKKQMDITDFLVQSYITDLTDVEMLRRPAGKANHLAWQLGHLISSEKQMMDFAKQGGSPELPSGFVEQHATSTSGSDDPKDFLSKKEYLTLYSAQRAASRKIIDELSEDEMQQAAPDHLKKVAATIGEMLVLVASHPMMHVGQWVVLRRELGKEILI